MMLLWKIDHIITGLNTGGAERALYNLLQSGMADSFDCRVVSLKGEGTMGAQIKALGVPVTSLGIQRGYPSYSVLRKLRQIIQERQPDLVQGWMYHGNLISVYAARMISRDIPLVWNIRHSLDDIKNEKVSTRLAIYLNRILSSNTRAIIYNSNHSKIQHESYGFTAKNSLVIPNGIDINKFNFNSDKGKKIRTELDIPGSAFVVGHIARYHPIKNHASFLIAARESLNKCQDLHFILVGCDVTEHNSTLMDMIPENYQNQFHLIGERHDISAILNAFDVFCLSSSSEAWPNVLGEAMACGLPCVSTDVGDARDIIGETGIIVPPKDPFALAAGLEKMIGLGAAERKKMGEAARFRIQENFDIKKISRRYYSFYNELVIR